MVTEQYITSLFYTSMDSYLKKDIEIFSQIKDNHEYRKGPSKEHHDITNLSLDYIGKLYEKNSIDFFFENNLSPHAVITLINQIEEDFTSLVIDKARTFAYDQETFRKELKKLLNASEEEALNGMDHYNDGSYIELPSYVGALSFICQVNDYWEEWIRLYEAMKVFPLKGSLAYRIKTPQCCIDVLKNIYLKPKGCVDVALFQDIFFYRTTESLKNLAQLQESKILEKSQIEKAANLYKDLTDNLRYLCSQFINISLQSLGTDNTVSWVVGLRNRFHNNNNPFTRHCVMVSDILFEKLIEEIKSKGPDISDISSSFDNNLFYLSIIRKDDYYASKSLIEALIKNTYSQYFSDIEPNEDGLEKLRTVYSHLSSNIEKSLAVIQKQQPRLEGYKTQPESINEFKRGNQFWLSALFLQLETTNDEEGFRKLVDLAFRLSREDDQFNACFIPLYIAELIASQVLRNCQNWYEAKLINEYPDLVEVVRILTANGERFSDEITESLRKRVNDEWLLEMAYKPYYNKDTIKYLVEFLGKSGISVPTSLH